MKSGVRVEKAFCNMQIMILLESKAWWKEYARTQTHTNVNGEIIDQRTSTTLHNTLCLSVFRRSNTTRRAETTGDVWPCIRPCCDHNLKANSSTFHWPRSSSSSYHKQLAIYAVYFRPHLHHNLHPSRDHIANVIGHWPNWSWSWLLIVMKDAQRKLLVLLRILDSDLDLMEEESISYFLFLIFFKFSFTLFVFLREFLWSFAFSGFAFHVGVPVCRNLFGLIVRSLLLY